jgi:hypothetical protein
MSIQIDKLILPIFKLALSIFLLSEKKFVSEFGDPLDTIGSRAQAAKRDSSNFHVCLEKNLEKYDVQFDRHHSHLFFLFFFVEQSRKGDPFVL